MGQEDKIKLSYLTEENVQKAISAIDEIRKRAEVMFIGGLKDSKEFAEIIDNAFDVIENILEARYQSVSNPTNHEAIANFFAIQDALESSEALESNNAETYKALYAFIKSARIVAFKPAYEIANNSVTSLRDLAMSEANIPRER